jgi:hypothetical protein
MENAVDKVKRKLWTFAYSVKDVSDIPGLEYDLLVDQKYQVKVLKAGADFERVPKRIVVAMVDGDEIRYHICRGGKCWEETSPLKAFPKVDDET